MEELRQAGLGDKARLLEALKVLLLPGSLGTGCFAFLAARDSIRATIETNDLPVAVESVYARLQAGEAEGGRAVSGGQEGGPEPGFPGRQGIPSAPTRFPLRPPGSRHILAIPEI